jgi:hypothetical protein
MVDKGKNQANLGGRIGGNFSPKGSFHYTASIVEGGFLVTL